MKIPPQFQVFADRAGVPVGLVLAAAGFIVLLTLSLLLGLTSGHHHVAPTSPRLAAVQAPGGAVASPHGLTPTTEQAAVAAASSSPSPTIAPAGLANALLPAVQAPVGELRPGWQVQVSVPPQDQGQDLAAQPVGTVIQRAASASFSGAVPPELQPFVTLGKPIRQTYSLYFSIPKPGSYLLASRLGGNAGGSISITLDGRADSIMIASRKWSRIWNPAAPAVATTATVNLDKGIHRLDVALDTDATDQATSAPTIDLYLKAGADTTPSALVPLWPESVPAAPVAASQPVQEARHG